MSIGIAMTWPDAVFDFTSTTLIGSMTPVASAVTMMSRRWMVAVWIGTVFVADDVQPAAAMSATYRILRFTANSGWRRFGCGMRKRNAVCGRLLEVAADEGLDIGFRGARIEARRDQVETGEVERGLSRGDVDLQRGADVVALRLHAKVLRGRLDLQELQRDGLLRRLVIHEKRREVLLREELCVAQVRLGVVFADAREDERLFARIVVEDRVRDVDSEARARRCGPAAELVALRGLGVLAVPAARRDRRDVGRGRGLVRGVACRERRGRRTHRGALERPL